MTQLLPYVLVLVCPISMGVMMWMMMRVGSGEKTASEARIARLEEKLREVQSAKQKEPEAAERLA
ncbi:MAG: hypothetical protein ABI838_03910 [Chloroflexota bacterium]